MKKEALKAAFPHTIPVMTGYLFLGISYGILMKTAGFPVWLPPFTALVIYTGSMEFLMVEILSSSFHPLQAFLTAFMVGSRHLFYGISMLKKYSCTGKKKFYLIFTTSDETFAVNASAEIPDTVDHGWFYFWVSFLDQIYWVAGAFTGAVIGSFLKFRIRGLDFVMTAMFVCILLDRWLKDGTAIKTVFKDHFPELTGLMASTAALLVFGPENFIIPAMILILICLTIPYAVSLRRR